MQSNRSSSSIDRDSPQRIPRRLSALLLLSAVNGCYGVGFGAFLTLLAPYLGQAVAFAAVAHILFGGVFLGSAVGVSANKAGAPWVILAVSMILVFGSAVKIPASFEDHNYGLKIFWCSVFAVSIFTAACALPCQRSLSRRVNRGYGRAGDAEQIAEAELPKKDC